MKWKGITYLIVYQLNKYKTYTLTFCIFPHVCEWCKIVYWLTYMYKRIHNPYGSFYSMHTTYCCTECNLEDK